MKDGKILGENIGLEQANRKMLIGGRFKRQLVRNIASYTMAISHPQTKFDDATSRKRLRIPSTHSATLRAGFTQDKY